VSDGGLTLHSRVLPTLGITLWKVCLTCHDTGLGASARTPGDGPDLSGTSAIGPAQPGDDVGTRVW